MRKESFAFPLFPLPLKPGKKENKTKKRKVANICSKLHGIFIFILFLYENKKFNDEIV